jgi:hypothetical protein
MQTQVDRHVTFCVILVRWILGKSVVTMGDGWNWLRIMASSGLWY